MTASLLESHGKDFSSRMDTSFQCEHILALGWKNTGNRSINGATQACKNPGISTDYLIGVIYVKEFRNQGGVTAYKAASNKMND